ncbi:MAG: ABC transporter substrate-binding protein [Syntrophomonadaceae bacterium]|nr:ABC transporter substrate-binding protein [Syntrophomonadaceae bacterium]
MRRSQKLLVILAIMALAMSWLLAGCGPTEGSEENAAGTWGSADGPVKIGVFEPLTGVNAAGGEMTIQGIELARELYPEILGMPVEVIIANTDSDPATAAKAVQNLISKEKVHIIIGSYGSTEALAGGSIARANQVCIIGCSPTAPAVTLDNECYFRVCFSDPFQGAVMADFAINTLNAETAAVIRDVQNDYSVSLSGSFTEAFAAVKGEEAIVATANFNSGDTDFSAQLTEINAHNPDIIFAPGNYAECGALIAQARELGMAMPMLGGDTWEAQEFLEQAAPWQDIYFSTHFTAEEPVTEISAYFMEAFKAKYPEASINAFAALGFDAYTLAKDAIERAGSLERSAIHDALAATTDFIGATGIITLDENGDAAKTVIIKQVKDGQFVYVAKAEPTAAPAADASTDPDADPAAEPADPAAAEPTP